MSIWFAIAYVALGIVAFGIIGYVFYVFFATILESRVGEDFMDEKNDDACEEAINSLDSSVDNFKKFVGLPRMVFYVLSTLLCWPVSVPYMLHEIKKHSKDLERYLRSW